MGIEDPLETESLLRPSTHPIAKSHNTTRARKKRGCDCSVSYRVILAWILSSAVTLLHAHRALYSQSFSPEGLDGDSYTLDKQLIMAAFYVGYALAAVPGGRAAERLGGKDVLLCAMLTWCCTNFFIPLFTDRLPLLVASRLVLGLAEGGMMPCCLHLVSMWFPESERTRAMCFIFSGVEVGTLLVLGFMPAVHGQQDGAGRDPTQFDWDNSFYIFGSLGLLWCLAHWALTSSTPEWHPRISLPEVQHITKERTLPTRLLDISQRDSVRWSRLVWDDASLTPIYVVHFSSALVWHLLLLWLPTYLRLRFALAVEEIALYMALPCASSLCASLGASWICDALVKKGVPALRVRRAMTLLGMLGPALALQLLQFARSAGAALAVLTPLVALCGLAPKAGYLSHIVDVAPNHSGIVMGMACSVSVLPSIMSNMIPQGAFHTLMLELNGAWSFMFAVCSFFLIGGSAVFVMGSTDDSAWLN